MAKYEELANIQNTYSKWTLELDKQTSTYIVQDETKLDMPKIETGERAIKKNMRQQTHC